MAEERKGKGGDKEVSRRNFLRLTGLAAAGTIVVACGAPAATVSPTAAPAPTEAAAAPTEAAAAPTEVVAAPTEASVATEAPAEVTEAPAEVTEAPAEVTEAPVEATEAATQEATPTREVPRGTVTDVPRNRTLILAWSGGDVGVGNPYAAGFNHQRGTAAMLEPLFFFSAFANKTIPWLAESYEYATDYKSVTIKIRSGPEWSDGTPFTAKDVAFTLNMLRQNEKLAYGGDMKKFVANAEAVDDTTAKVTFTQAAPRFVYDFMSSKFDLGLFWVPEHAFKDVKDVSTFTWYDPAQNTPLVTGPYKIADWTPEQEIMDLRKDWWAAKSGFAALPEVERIVVIPFADATTVAQEVISNEVDSSLDFRPPVMTTILDKNEKIITHTGRDKPYGYTDWWPNSLWLNCEVPPYNDVEVRHAVNHAIDRAQIVEIGYEGAGIPTELPFPQFPSLTKYIDAAKPLLEKYPVNAFDLSKTEEIMTKKGFTKNGDGLWVGADGNTLDATIYGFDIFADYGPVLAEQLRNGGFDSSFQAPPDAGTRMADGSAKMFLFGHGGAIADVYPTLDLWHSRHNSPIGTAGDISARWKNDEFDKTVDQLSQLPVGDDKGMPLYLKALEIYLQEFPDIPIIQWLHRIPYNTTYWTNWPTAQNPYVNGAFWHKTFPLILHQLKKVS